MSKTAMKQRMIPPLSRSPTSKREEIAPIVKHLPQSFHTKTQDIVSFFTDHEVLQESARPLDRAGNNAYRDQTKWEAMEVRYIDYSGKSPSFSYCSDGNDGQLVGIRELELLDSRKNLHRQMVKVEKVVISDLLNTPRQICGRPGTSRMSEYKPRDFNKLHEFQLSSSLSSHSDWEPPIPPSPVKSPNLYPVRESSQHGRMCKSPTARGLCKYDIDQYRMAALDVLIQREKDKEAKRGGQVCDLRSPEMIQNGRALGEKTNERIPGRQPNFKKYPMPTPKGVYNGKRNISSDRKNIELLSKAREQIIKHRERMEKAKQKLTKSTTLPPTFNSKSVSAKSKVVHHNTAPTQTQNKCYPNSLFNKQFCAVSSQSNSKQHNFCIRGAQSEESVKNSVILNPIKERRVRSTPRSLLKSIRMQQQRHPLQDGNQQIHGILKSPTAKATQALCMYFQKPHERNSSVEKLSKEHDVSVAEILEAYQTLFFGAKTSDSRTLDTSYEISSSNDRNSLKKINDPFPLPKNPRQNAKPKFTRRPILKKVQTSPKVLNKHKELNSGQEMTDRSKSFSDSPYNDTSSPPLSSSSNYTFRVSSLQGSQVSRQRKRQKRFLRSYDRDPCQYTVVRKKSPKSSYSHIHFKRIKNSDEPVVHNNYKCVKGKVCINARKSNPDSLERKANSNITRPLNPFKSDATCYKVSAKSKNIPSQVKTMRKGNKTHSSNGFNSMENNEYTTQLQTNKRSKSPLRRGNKKNSSTLKNTKIQSAQISSNKTSKAEVLSPHRRRSFTTCSIIENKTPTKKPFQNDSKPTSHEGHPSTFNSRVEDKKLKTDEAIYPATYVLNENFPIPYNISDSRKNVMPLPDCDKSSTIEGITSRAKMSSSKGQLPTVYYIVDSQNTSGEKSQKTIKPKNTKRDCPKLSSMLKANIKNSRSDPGIENSKLWQKKMSKRIPNPGLTSIGVSASDCHQNPVHYWTRQKGPVKAAKRTMTLQKDCEVRQTGTISSCDHLEKGKLLNSSKEVCNSNMQPSSTSLVTGGYHHNQKEYTPRTKDQDKPVVEKESEIKRNPSLGYSLETLIDKTHKNVSSKTFQNSQQTIFWCAGVKDNVELDKKENITETNITNSKLNEFNSISKKCEYKKDIYHNQLCAQLKESETKSVGKEVHMGTGNEGKIQDQIPLFDIDYGSGEQLLRPLEMSKKCKTNSNSAKSEIGIDVWHENCIRGMEEKDRETEYKTKDRDACGPSKNIMSNFPCNQSESEHKEKERFSERGSQKGNINVELIKTSIVNPDLKIGLDHENKLEITSIKKEMDNMSVLENDSTYVSSKFSTHASSKLVSIKEECVSPKNAVTVKEQMFLNETKCNEIKASRQETSISQTLFLESNKTRSYQSPNKSMVLCEFSKKFSLSPEKAKITHSRIESDRWGKTSEKKSSASSAPDYFRGTAFDKEIIEFYNPNQGTRVYSDTIDSNLGKTTSINNHLLTNGSISHKENASSLQQNNICTEADHLIMINKNIDALNSLSAKSINTGLKITEDEYKRLKLGEISDLYTLIGFSNSEDGVSDTKLNTHTNSKPKTWSSKNLIDSKMQYAYNEKLKTTDTVLIESELNDHQNLMCPKNWNETSKPYLIAQNTRNEYTEERDKSDTLSSTNFRERTVRNVVDSFTNPRQNLTPRDIKVNLMKKYPKLNKEGALYNFVQRKSGVAVINKLNVTNFQDTNNTIKTKNEASCFDWSLRHTSKENDPSLSYSEPMSHINNRESMEIENSSNDLKVIKDNYSEQHEKCKIRKPKLITTSENFKEQITFQKQNLDNQKNPIAVSFGLDNYETKNFPQPFSNDPEIADNLIKVCDNSQSQANAADQNDTINDEFHPTNYPGYWDFCDDSPFCIFLSPTESHPSRTSTVLDIISRHCQDKNKLKSSLENVDPNTKSVMNGKEEFKHQSDIPFVTQYPITTNKEHTSNDEEANNPLIEKESNHPDKKIPSNLEDAGVCVQHYDCKIFGPLSSSQTSIPKSDEEFAIEKSRSPTPHDFRLELNERLGAFEHGRYFQANDSNECKAALDINVEEKELVKVTLSAENDECLEINDDDYNIKSDNKYDRKGTLVNFEDSTLSADFYGCKALVNNVNKTCYPDDECSHLDKEKFPGIYTQQMSTLSLPSNDTFGLHCDLCDIIDLCGNKNAQFNCLDIIPPPLQFRTPCATNRIDTYKDIYSSNETDIIVDTKTNFLNSENSATISDGGYMDSSRTFKTVQNIVRKESLVEQFGAGEIGPKSISTIGVLENRMYVENTNQVIDTAFITLKPGETESRVMSCLTQMNNSGKDKVTENFIKLKENNVVVRKYDKSIENDEMSQTPVANIYKTENLDGTDHCLNLDSNGEWKKVTAVDRSNEFVEDSLNSANSFEKIDKRNQNAESIEKVLCLDEKNVDIHNSKEEIKATDNKFKKSEELVEVGVLQKCNRCSVIDRRFEILEENDVLEEYDSGNVEMNRVDKRHESSQRSKTVIDHEKYGTVRKLIACIEIGDEVNNTLIDFERGDTIKNSSLSIENKRIIDSINVEVAKGETVKQIVADIEKSSQTVKGDMAELETDNVMLRHVEQFDEIQNITELENNDIIFEKNESELKDNAHVASPTEQNKLTIISEPLDQKKIVIIHKDDNFEKKLAFESVGKMTVKEVDNDVENNFFIQHKAFSKQIVTVDASVQAGDFDVFINKDDVFTKTDSSVEIGTRGVEKIEVSEETRELKHRGMNDNRSDGLINDDKLASATEKGISMSNDDLWLLRGNKNLIFNRSIKNTDVHKTIEKDIAFVASKTSKNSMADYKKGEITKSHTHSCNLKEMNKIKLETFEANEEEVGLEQKCQNSCFSASVNRVWTKRCEEISKQISDVDDVFLSQIPNVVEMSSSDMSKSIKQPIVNNKNSSLNSSPKVPYCRQHGVRKRLELLQSDLEIPFIQELKQYYNDDSFTTTTHQFDTDETYNIAKCRKLPHDSLAITSHQFDTDTACRNTAKENVVNTIDFDTDYEVDTNDTIESLSFLLDDLREKNNTKIQNEMLDVQNKLETHSKSKINEEFLFDKMPNAALKDDSLSSLKSSFDDLDIEKCKNSSIADKTVKAFLEVFSNRFITSLVSKLKRRLQTRRRCESGCNSRGFVKQSKCTCYVNQESMETTGMLQVRSDYNVDNLTFKMTSPYVVFGDFLKDRGQKKKSNSLPTDDHVELGINKIITSEKENSSFDEIPRLASNKVQIELISSETSGLEQDVLSPTSPCIIKNSPEMKGYAKNKSTHIGKERQSMLFEHILNAMAFDIQSYFDHLKTVAVSCRVPRRFRGCSREVLYFRNESPPAQRKNSQGQIKSLPPQQTWNENCYFRPKMSCCYRQTSDRSQTKETNTFTHSTSSATCLSEQSEEVETQLVSCNYNRPHLRRMPTGRFQFPYKHVIIPSPTHHGADNHEGDNEDYDYKSKKFSRIPRIFIPSSYICLDNVWNQRLDPQASLSGERIFDAQKAYTSFEKKSCVSKWKTIQSDNDLDTFNELRSFSTEMQSSSNLTYTGSLSSHEFFKRYDSSTDTQPESSQSSLECRVYKNRRKRSTVKPDMRSFGHRPSVSPKKQRTPREYSSNSSNSSLGNLPQCKKIYRESCSHYKRRSTSKTLTTLCKDEIDRAGIEQKVQSIISMTMLRFMRDLMHLTRKSPAVKGSANIITQPEQRISKHCSKTTKSTSLTTTIKHLKSHSNILSTLLDNETSYLGRKSLAFSKQNVSMGEAEEWSPRTIEGNPGNEKSMPPRWISQEPLALQAIKKTLYPKEGQLANEEITMESRFCKKENNESNLSWLVFPLLSDTENRSLFAFETDEVIGKNETNACSGVEKLTDQPQNCNRYKVNDSKECEKLYFQERPDTKESVNQIPVFISDHLITKENLIPSGAYKSKSWNRYGYQFGDETHPVSNNGNSFDIFGFCYDLKKQTTRNRDEFQSCDGSGLKEIKSGNRYSKNIENFKNDEHKSSEKQSSPPNHSLSPQVKQDNGKKPSVVCVSNTTSDLLSYLSSTSHLPRGRSPRATYFKRNLKLMENIPEGSDPSDISSNENSKQVERVDKESQKQISLDCIRTQDDIFDSYISRLSEIRSDMHAKFEKVFENKKVPKGLPFEANKSTCERGTKRCQETFTIGNRENGTPETKVRVAAKDIRDLKPHCVDMDKSTKSVPQSSTTLSSFLDNIQSADGWNKCWSVGTIGTWTKRSHKSNIQNQISATAVNNVFLGTPPVTRHSVSEDPVSPSKSYTKDQSQTYIDYKTNAFDNQHMVDTTTIWKKNKKREVVIDPFNKCEIGPLYADEEIDKPMTDVSLHYPSRPRKIDENEDSFKLAEHKTATSVTPEYTKSNSMKLESSGCQQIYSTKDTKNGDENEEIKEFPPHTDYENYNKNDDVSRSDDKYRTKSKNDSVPLRALNEGNKHTSNSLFPEINNSVMCYYSDERNAGNVKMFETSHPSVNDWQHRLDPSSEKKDPQVLMCITDTSHDKLENDIINHVLSNHSFTDRNESFKSSDDGGRGHQHKYWHVRPLSEAISLDSNCTQREILSSKYGCSVIHLSCEGQFQNAVPNVHTSEYRNEGILNNTDKTEPDVSIIDPQYKCENPESQHTSQNTPNKKTNLTSVSESKSIQLNAPRCKDYIVNRHVMNTQDKEKKHHYENSSKNVLCDYACDTSVLNIKERVARLYGEIPKTSSCSVMHCVCVQQEIKRRERSNESYRSNFSMYKSNIKSPTHYADKRPSRQINELSNKIKAINQVEPSKKDKELSHKISEITTIGSFIHPNKKEKDFSLGDFSCTRKPDAQKDLSIDKRTKNKLLEDILEKKGFKVPLSKSHKSMIGGSVIKSDLNSSMILNDKLLCQSDSITSNNVSAQSNQCFASKEIHQPSENIGIRSQELDTTLRHASRKQQNIRPPFSNPDQPLMKTLEEACIMKRVLNVANNRDLEKPNNRQESSPVQDLTHTMAHMTTHVIPNTQPLYAVTKTVLHDTSQEVVGIEQIIDRDNNVQNMPNDLFSLDNKMQRDTTKTTSGGTTEYESDSFLGEYDHSKWEIKASELAEILGGEASANYIADGKDPSNIPVFGMRRSLITNKSTDCSQIYDVDGSLLHLENKDISFTADDCHSPKNDSSVPEVKKEEPRGYEEDNSRHSKDHVRSTFLSKQTLQSCEKEKSCTLQENIPSLTSPSSNSEKFPVNPTEFVLQKNGVHHQMDVSENTGHVDIHNTQKIEPGFLAEKKSSYEEMTVGENQITSPKHTQSTFNMNLELNETAANGFKNKFYDMMSAPPATLLGKDEKFHTHTSKSNSQDVLLHCHGHVNDSYVCPMKIKKQIKHQDVVHFCSQEKVESHFSSKHPSQYYDEENSHTVQGNAPFEIQSSNNEAGFAIKKNITQLHDSENREEGENNNLEANKPGSLNEAIVYKKRNNHSENQITSIQAKQSEVYEKLRLSDTATNRLSDQSNDHINTLLTHKKPCGDNRRIHSTGYQNTTSLTSSSNCKRSVSCSRQKYVLKSGDHFSRDKKRHCPSLVTESSSSLSKKQNKEAQSSLCEIDTKSSQSEQTSLRRLSKSVPRKRKSTDLSFPVEIKTGSPHQIVEEFKKSKVKPSQIPIDVYNLTPRGKRTFSPTTRTLTISGPLMNLNIPVFRHDEGESLHGSTEIGGKLKLPRATVERSRKNKTSVKIDSRRVLEETSNPLGQEHKLKWKGVMKKLVSFGKKKARYEVEEGK